MIEIEKVTWRNLMSYGDYDTELDISNLGDTLISGENGAGKSTAISAIQWCLFNKTMHRPKTGPNIHNWDNRLPTRSYVDLKNGLRIDRTRERSGENNLYIYNRHLDEADAINAMGTSRLQNNEAQSRLGLDWDMFTASTCLGQFNKPWLMMTADKRKKAIERLLKLDIFETCSQAADTLKVGISGEIIQNEKSLEQEATKLEALIAENELLKTKKERLKQERDKKRIDAVKSLEDAIRYLENNEFLNIEELEALIARRREMDVAISKLDVIKSKINNEIHSVNTQIEVNKRNIESLKSKNGEVCSGCRQLVSAEHVAKETSGFQEIISGLINRNVELKSKIDEVMVVYNKIMENMPSIPYTLDHAKLINNNILQVEKNIETIKNNIELLDDQELVDNVDIEQINRKLEEYRKNIDEIDKNLKSLKYNYKHTDYLYSYYSRRDMGKSVIFADHVPNINSRLQFYLDHFESPIDIKLSENLSIESSKWGYDFASGGERSSVDMALMFGIYDFYESIYGRQSNFIVLDEVDRSVDDKRRQKLIELIKVDLSQRMDCILVISHSGSMHNIFSREYKAIKTDEGSRLVEI